MIREANFAGRFYPDSKESIFDLIRKIENERRYPFSYDKPGTIIGAVLPHAGHIYSGHQTIPFFKYLIQEKIIPETIVILNPNHTGFGEDIAIDPHYAWNNPVGKVYLDTELSSLLPYPKDPYAQAGEHSAEVILPFIQYYFPENDVKILPVCIRKQTSGMAIQLARDLFENVKGVGRNVIVIASSDFSHFLSPESGFRKDQLVLDEVKKRDVIGVEKRIREHRISVCGYGPVMTLMSYAELVDKNYITEVMARGNSGEVHSSRDVVDYISILFQAGR
jgi:AmmeMemoRadiSam system protein B